MFVPRTVSSKVATFSNRSNLELLLTMANVLPTMLVTSRDHDAPTKSGVHKTVLQRPNQAGRWTQEDLGATRVAPFP